jgi:hypothetical protein
MSAALPPGLNVDSTLEAVIVSRPEVEPAPVAQAPSAWC